MPSPLKARLLIVDDEALHLEALCSTLEPEGYQTTGFTSANQAVHALRSGGEFDLLLTDLQMPEMDGISLLRTALGVDGNLVGIMMTGYGTITTAVQAMSAGALDYILKPFKLSVILPVLSRALEVRRLRMENAELAQRVRARTSELEAANKELDAFAFSVSHDLRAPLRAAGSFLRMLAQDHSAQMPPEAQRLLAHVATNTGRMEQLIEDLLRFSRMSRQQLVREPVKTAALVKEVLEELRKQHAGRRLEIQVGDLPDCHADPSLLRQVFVNLLSNAFKYTGPRENAQIGVGGQLQAGEHMFFIRDNGVGFDMKYADRLFGVFQRLHPGNEFEGTGVGLSIVQRIISRHGGRIWAEAEVNRGATFHFNLPMVSS